MVGAFTTSNFGAATTFAMPVGLALINVVFVLRVLPESMPEGVLLHQGTRLTPPMLRATPPLIRPPMPSRGPMPKLREHQEVQEVHRKVQPEVVREVAQEDEIRGDVSQALGGSCCRCGALELLFAGFRLLRQDKTSTLWRLCAATFCAYFVFFGFICNYQIFLQTALHVMPTGSASYIASFSLFSLCTKSSIMPMRQVLSERALIQLGFVALAVGSALLAALRPTPASVTAAALAMAVGLIASPVMLSVASAITPSSRQGAVQALLQAFSCLAEGVGPATFGWLLASTPPGRNVTALPGLPFCLGVGVATLGLLSATSAIDRGTGGTDQPDEAAGGSTSSKTMRSLSYPLMLAASSPTPRAKLESRGLFDDL